MQACRTRHTVHACTRGTRGYEDMCPCASWPWRMCPAGGHGRHVAFSMYTWRTKFSLHLVVLEAPEKPIHSESVTRDLREKERGKTDSVFTVNS